MKSPIMGDSEYSLYAVDQSAYSQAPVTAFPNERVIWYLNCICQDHFTANKMLAFHTLITLLISAHPSTSPHFSLNTLKQTSTTLIESRRQFQTCYPTFSDEELPRTLSRFPNYFQGKQNGCIIYHILGHYTHKITATWYVTAPGVITSM